MRGHRGFKEALRNGAFSGFGAPLGRLWSPIGLALERSWIGFSEAIHLY